MSKNQYYVYILTNKNRTTLYTGMTNNLQRRILEHKNKVVSGFTNNYNLDHLVFVEAFETADQAHENEHRLKKWRKEWKINLINKNNPQWNDLSSQLF